MSMCEHEWKCSLCGEKWTQPSIVGVCGHAVIGLERYSMTVPYHNTTTAHIIFYDNTRHMMCAHSGAWDLSRNCCPFCYPSSSSSSLTSDSNP